MAKETINLNDWVIFYFKIYKMHLFSKCTPENHTSCIKKVSTLSCDNPKFLLKML